MSEKKPCILVIDDDPSVRQSFRFILKDTFRLLAAPGALEGKFYLSQYPIEVVILDIRLRGSDGMQLLADIRKHYPAVEVIMITAYASLNTVRSAIRLGAFDYLIKPFDKDELTSVVRNALKQQRQRAAALLELYKLRESSLYMENMLREARSAMVSSSEHFVSAALDNIHSRDGYTRVHAERVARFSLLIGESMGLDESDLRLITTAAHLHDIGKVTMNEKLLNRDYRFSNCDHRAMKEHASAGASMIRAYPWTAELSPAIRHHHERYDGAGYPDGLAKTDIPLPARIITVADAVDAMLHSPARQRELKIGDVALELHGNAGGQFDPAITDLVLSEKLLPAP